MTVKETITGQELIVLFEAIEYLQIDHNQEDAIIARMVKSSRAFIEKFCGISMVEKTIDLVWNDFYADIILPYGPVISIQSCKLDGVVISDPDLSGDYLNEIGRKLECTYTAGYGDKVPADLLEAHYQILKLFYDNRGVKTDLPLELQAILDVHNRNLFI